MPVAASLRRLSSHVPLFLLVRSLGPALLPIEVFDIILLFGWFEESVVLCGLNPLLVLREFFILVCHSQVHSLADVAGLELFTLAGCADVVDGELMG